MNKAQELIDLSESAYNYTDDFTRRVNKRLEESPEIEKIEPGQYKQVHGTAGQKVKGYAARNKKGELGWYSTPDGAKKHAEQ